MAGGKSVHVTIEMNIGSELFQQLRGKTCIPRNSSQAVKLSGSRGYVFPDVTVVCGKPEFVTKRGIDCLLNPTVIIEVLSPSTAAFDETQKLLAFTALPTVRQYLVVASDHYAAKLYFRSSPEQTWSVNLYDNLTDTIHFDSCDCKLTLAEIYTGVDLPPFNGFN